MAAQLFGGGRGGETALGEMLMKGDERRIVDRDGLRVLAIAQAGGAVRANAKIPERRESEPTTRAGEASDHG